MVLADHVLLELLTMNLLKSVLQSAQAVLFGQMLKKNVCVHPILLMSTESVLDVKDMSFLTHLYKDVSKFAILDMFTTYGLIDADQNVHQSKVTLTIWVTVFAP